MSRSRSFASLAFAILMGTGCGDDSGSPTAPAPGNPIPVDSQGPLQGILSVATSSFEPVILRDGTVYQLGWSNGNAVVQAWDSANGWRIAAQGSTLPTSWLYFDVQGGAMATLAIDATWKCPLRVNSSAGSWSPTNSTAWKETIATTGTRVAWIDYRHAATGSVNSEVYLAEQGTAVERRLTDDSIYQTKVAMDGNWLVWVEYLHGKRANIRWMDLATGETRLLDAQATHQDQPRVADGWVVWEDYRNAGTDTTNIDLWGWSPATGSVPLVVAAGYQGSASLSQGRLVWEDHAGTDGSPALKAKPLAGTDTTTVVLLPGGTSGAFQGKPSLQGERLAWIASSGSVAEVRVGRWPRP